MPKLYRTSIYKFRAKKQQKKALKNLITNEEEEEKEEREREKERERWRKTRSMWKRKRRKKRRTEREQQQQQQQQQNDEYKKKENNNNKMTSIKEKRTTTKSAFLFYFIFSCLSFSLFCMVLHNKILCRPKCVSYYGIANTVPLSVCRSSPSLVS